MSDNRKPLLVLIPTLNRHEQVAECVKLLTTMGTGLADIIVLEGDTEIVPKVNSIPLEMITKYKIVGVLNDDMFVRTPKWDEIICSSLEGKLGLVFGRDGIREFLENERGYPLSTYQFLSTEIPLTLGWIYIPELIHYCCDNGVWTLMRMANWQPDGNISRPETGCYIYREDLLIEHLHYNTGKTKKDETYSKSELLSERDSDVFKDYCNNRRAGDAQKLINLINNHKLQYKW